MARADTSLLIVGAHANLGHKTSTKGEAYQRVFPTVAAEFG